MRGFPIVALVAITGTYYNNCNIIAPKFVQNEWHYTENNLIKFYKEEYNQGYIKSIKFLENNLNSTSGIPTTCSGSFAYYWYDHHYGDVYKSQKAHPIRIDCFYTKSIYDGFYNLLQTEDFTMQKLYANLPNLVNIYSGFNLLVAKNMINIMLNMPKLLSCNSQFFYTSRNLANLYINAPRWISVSEKNFFYDTNWNGKFVNIYGFSSENNNKIINLFNKYKYSNVTFVNAGTCSLDVFDLRYWSKYENETGLDVGLLEGSNLR